MKTPGMNFNAEARERLEDKEWLEEEYVSKRRSVSSIADSLGCHDLTVRASLEKFNIRIRTKSEALRGIRRTPEWRMMISETRKKTACAKDEKNPNWKGGSSKAGSKERGRMWGLKLEAKKRDGFACVRCGKEEHKCPSCNQYLILHVDHIKPFKDYPQLRFSLDNLQTLCQACHQDKSKAES